MNDNYNILIVGVGGQGILLASDITSNAAMIEGFDVKKSEIHGMSQRGGSVFSHIRFGKKVYSPVIPECKADILVAFEEMEALRWLDFVNKDTKLIINKNRILPAETTSYPEGIIPGLKDAFSSVMEIDQERLVKEIGKPKYLNTALLGFASKYIKFKEESWKRAIQEESPEGTFAENYEAFRKGKNFKET
jgi:indolepyruvate ferredoxin oxidoreductase beta subunit